jgi:SAM-dependent methyltransferase
MPRITVAEKTGFRTFRILELALYHSLGKLPEPELTHERGYVTDVPYVRNFLPYLAPAILDYVALLSGFAPPSRDDNFAYCDLGGRQGVTTALLAATHPRGIFHGVDFMAGHIDHAQRLCRETATSNAVFHHADFGSAARMGLPQFDYIVCHGVYAWVNAEVQQEIQNFIGTHLKPGGIAYISYNAMPGWAGDLAFQYLVRAIGRTSPADSHARITAALEMIQTMISAKVPALVDSVIG